jgi:hypothetical protein
MSSKQHTSAYVSIRQHTEDSCKDAQHGPRDVYEATYVSVRQRTSAYGVSRRQQTEDSCKENQDGPRDVYEAAYVSIRQYTSAYVSKLKTLAKALRMARVMSVKQHTSAYVSIRQHMSAN